MATSLTTAEAGVVMSEDEASVLRSLMSTKDAANVVIPDDIGADDLLRFLSVTTKAIRRAEDAVTRLKPFLGRILLVVKTRKLYTDLGYSSYDDWMTRGVNDLYGVARSEAFRCVAIAEELGFLPADKVEELGFSKMSVAASAIRRSTTKETPVEMRRARADEWVKAAEENTVSGLKELIVSKGLAEKGELDPREHFAFLVNPEQKKLLQEFVDAPEVQEYCGTSDTGTILVRSAEESRGEWTAQTLDSLRG